MNEYWRMGGRVFHIPLVYTGEEIRMKINGSMRIAIPPEKVRRLLKKGQNSLLWLWRKRK
jgi:hypothetical protein